MTLGELIDIGDPEELRIYEEFLTERNLDKKIKTLEELCVFIKRQEQNMRSELNRKQEQIGLLKDQIRVLKERNKDLENQAKNRGEIIDVLKALQQENPDIMHQEALDDISSKYKGKSLNSGLLSEWFDDVIDANRTTESQRKSASMFSVYNMLDSLDDEIELLRRASKKK